MVPKADIKSVPVTITKEDLVHVFRNTGLTRLPRLQSNFGYAAWVCAFERFGPQARVQRLWRAFGA